MGKPSRSMSKVKFIDAGELRDLGILQEVNRRFFHPLGLSLAVRKRRKSYRPTWEVAGIVDRRDDPEGVIFPVDESGMTREKFDTFNRLWDERVNERVERLGYVEQPFPTKWEQIEEISRMVDDLEQQAEAEEEPDPELVDALRTNLLGYARQEMNLESGDLPYRLARQLKIDGVV